MFVWVVPPLSMAWALPSRFLAEVSIELCSITETLESQVAEMCTIDLFHCGSQQWLFAPQHRAPQEEPAEHTETQSLCRVRGAVPLCPVHCHNVLCCCESHPLLCSYTDNVLSDCRLQVLYIINTLIREICAASANMLFFTVGYFLQLSELNCLMAVRCRVWRGWEPSKRNITLFSCKPLLSTYCTLEGSLKGW